MATAELSTKSIGSIIKIKVNGTLRNFIVVQRGRPSSFYDSTTWNNTTIVLMENIYEQRAWNTTKNNDYANSAIHSYLNNGFISLLEKDVANALVSVKIPYRVGSGTGKTIASGANGLSTKVFLLGFCELGLTSSYNSYIPDDGIRFAYFQDGDNTTANSLRLATLEGAITPWWSRSAQSAKDDVGSVNVSYVNIAGRFSLNNPSTFTHGVRPALALPSSLMVSDDGTIITNQPPTTPTSLTLPDVIRGGVQFPISWSPSTDPDGNLAGYNLDRSLDGGANWARVYADSGTSTTDKVTFGTASVQYRVQAFDTMGEASQWFGSGTKLVVNNTAPTAPPSITVPEPVAGGEPLTVSWAQATDVDGNLTGYELDRADDGGAFVTRYTGPALTYHDEIPRGLSTVRYRVRAVDSYDEHSAYALSDVLQVDNNRAPRISCTEPTQLGVKSDDFSVSYSVHDEDGDELQVTESIDGEITRTYTPVLDEPQRFNVAGIGFMKLLNGAHTLQITVCDPHGKSDTLSLGWTKAVHACRITMEQPLPTADSIEKMVLSITRSVPADAVFRVLVTNNALDDTPMWEDVTAQVTAGINYIFQNNAAEWGYAFNFIVEAERAPGGGGGYIASIGGAFE